MPIDLPVRLPWPPDFPDVVIHTDVQTRDSHAHYHAAKAGDADAALSLAIDLIHVDGIAELRRLIGGRPAALLPVIADETTGFNAIPDAMAQVLARDLHMEVIAGEIVQTNKVGHTRAPAFQRLVTPAAFDGPSSAVSTMCWWTIMWGWAARLPTYGAMSRRVGELFWASPP